MFEYFATNIFRLSNRYCKLNQVISRISLKYKKHKDEDFIKYLSNISLFLSNYRLKPIFCNSIYVQILGERYVSGNYI